MDVYLDVVMILNFLIDTLLLLGANRLCGFPLKLGRACLAGLLGSVYTGVCFLPGLAFLGNFLWRLLCLFGMGSIAYGWSGAGIRRTFVFALLALALGGLGTAMAKPGFLGLVGSAGALAVLCFVAFRERPGQARYLPVELTLGSRHMKLTALQDTGNTLRDPISGANVLVVGAEIAEKLTGLTAGQLKNPVETIGAIPGLQLIPYQSVGCTQGLLLAMRIPKVKIGSWQGSRLVAFAPDGLSEDGSYQALTGGCI